MSLNDPIADMLTNIRNANLARKEFVDMPSSKTKEQIAEVLKKEGYILDYKKEADQSKIRMRIFFKDVEKNGNVIHGLKRISKIGRRIYSDVDNIPKVIGGLGITILSTSKGIMTHKEAKKNRVGGEVLAMVW